MAAAVQETIETRSASRKHMEPGPRPTAEQMSGARKVAILCLTLGEDAASTIFKHLDEDEIELVSKELAALSNVRSQVSESVVEEFNQLMASRSYVTSGGVDYA